MHHRKTRQQKNRCYFEYRGKTDRKLLSHERVKYRHFKDTWNCFRRLKCCQIHLFHMRSIVRVLCNWSGMEKSSTKAKNKIILKNYLVINYDNISVITVCRINKGKCSVQTLAQSFKWCQVSVASYTRFDKSVGKTDCMTMKRLSPSAWHCF
jgi:hypothetical protein